MIEKVDENENEFLGVFVPQKMLTENAHSNCINKSWVSTLHNVLPGNTDVAVSVAARLFMIKAQCVKKLVLDGIIVDAATTSQGQGLCVTQASDIRVASVKRIRLIRNMTRWFLLYPQSRCLAPVLLTCFLLI